MRNSHKFLRNQEKFQLQWNLPPPPAVAPPPRRPAPPPWFPAVTGTYWLREPLPIWPLIQQQHWSWAIPEYHVGVVTEELSDTTNYEHLRWTFCYPLTPSIHTSMEQTPDHLTWGLQPTVDEGYLWDMIWDDHLNPSRVSSVSWLICMTLRYVLASALAHVLNRSSDRSSQSTSKLLRICGKLE